MSELFNALAECPAHPSPSLHQDWKRETMQTIRHELSSYWNASEVTVNNPIVFLYFALYSDPEGLAIGECDNIRPIWSRVQSHISARLNTPRSPTERTVINAVRGGA
jgi:hypothetical protein